MGGLPLTSKQGREIPHMPFLKIPWEWACHTNFLSIFCHRTLTNKPTACLTALRKKPCSLAVYDCAGILHSYYVFQRGWCSEKGWRKKIIFNLKSTVPDHSPCRQMVHGQAKHHRHGSLWSRWDCCKLLNFWIVCICLAKHWIFIIKNIIQIANFWTSPCGCAFNWQIIWQVIRT